MGPKLQIKSLPRNNVMKNPEDSWKVLNQAINEIYLHNSSKLSFEELYRISYNLANNGFGEFLYESMRDKIKSITHQISLKVEMAPDDLILSSIQHEWEDHTVSIKVVSDIFMYMSRTFIIHQKKMGVIESGLEYFLNEVILKNTIRERLISKLLQLIEKERNHEMIDGELVNVISRMLFDVSRYGFNVYEEEFEKNLLLNTRNFYLTQASDLLRKNTCPECLIQIEALLQEENDRAKFLFSSQSHPKIMKIVEEELIKNQANTLVEFPNTGCEMLFTDNRIEDLRRMYRLFNRVPSTLGSLRLAFTKHIKKFGGELYDDPNISSDEIGFIKKLFEKHQQMSSIVKDAFQGEQECQKLMKQAFELFINHNSKCASFLAAYVDFLLKNPQHELEMKKEIDNAMIVFRYLHDKDVFEAQYKVLMSKRLLSSKSHDDQYEESIVRKLKTEYGCQFTSKIEGMLNDINISRITMEKFRTSGQHIIGNTELSVHILAFGYWPIQTCQPCQLPQEVARCTEAFEIFYHSQHTGRRLSWNTSKGEAEIRAKFGTKQYEFICSTFQMCILMLFNETTELSLDDIKNQTNIPEQDLKLHLHGLCSPKIKVLTKITEKTADDQEIFGVNVKFTNSLRRLKIPVAKKASNQSEPILNVEEDRKNMIEASIVRIMKARKLLAHNDLITEVIRQLSVRFLPQPQQIKQRIESLIEREYLERDTNDRRSYRYLA